MLIRYQGKTMQLLVQIVNSLILMKFEISHVPYFNGTDFKSDIGFQKLGTQIQF